MTPPSQKSVAKHRFLPAPSKRGGQNFWRNCPTNGSLHMAQKAAAGNTGRGNFAFLELSRVHLADVVQVLFTDAAHQEVAVFPLVVDEAVE